MNKANYNTPASYLLMFYSYQLLTNVLNRNSLLITSFIFHCKLWMLANYIILAIRPLIIVYVISWVAVKFGINTTSVVLEMGKISRGEAE